MQEIIDRCNKCSLKQNLHSSIKIFPEKLAEAFRANQEFQKIITKNQSTQNEWNKIINFAFSDNYLSKNLILPPDAKEELIKFKSACECCDCTRDSTKNILSKNSRNGYCLDNAANKKQEAEKILQKNKQIHKQLMNFYDEVMSFIIDKRKSLMFEEKQLLTRCYTNKKNKNEFRNGDISPIMNEIVMVGMAAISKCITCCIRTLKN